MAMAIVNVRRTQVPRAHFTAMGQRIFARAWCWRKRRARDGLRDPGEQPLFGRSALARFDRDVLATAGVDYVIVLIGINDIGPRARAPYRRRKRSRPTTSSPATASSSRAPTRRA